MNRFAPVPSLAGLAAAVLVLAVAGCASSTHRAPVETRATRPAPAPAAAAPAEIVPKPGTVVVKPGDTLIRIALDAGQNWRDVARWNSLDNPNLIEVGQVLRIAPPAPEPGATAAQPVAGGRAEARPLDARPGATAASTPVTASASASAPAAAASGAAVAPAASAVATAARDDPDEVQWAWPAAGAVTTPFDEVRSKGLAIAGKPGDPVLAAGDGRVVYAGVLRGYGNLVIVKHNNTYLSAYAHNQTLLVKEDQVVRKGQRIAEMGASDAERVQLHFEIRRNGKPLDPARLLPAR